MKGKAGGMAVGAAVAAIAYLTSGLHTGDTTSSSARPKGVTVVNPQSHAPSATDKPAPFETVEVFYATDRAVIGASRPIKRQVFGVMAIACGVGALGLTAWLEWRGRRTGALVAIVSGTSISAALLFLGPGLMPQVRGITEPVIGANPYSGERGELHMGKCQVTIPRTHKEGELEQPSILRLEIIARPDRDILLQQVIPQADAVFYEEVKRRVQASPRHDLFVFVHGYNVTFESAARRTAQIAYDLKYEGAPIFYSWPSQGHTLKYTVDETNVAWSAPHLKKFLRDLAQNSGATSIHLIAHSMGTRALTQAVRELAYEGPPDQRLFKQVILAAPDIDADVFREQIAPELARNSEQVTLYASASDEALVASKLVHGTRRAGETDDEPLVVRGVDTIEVELSNLGLLGHSYYSNPHILRDLRAILRESRPASSRPWLRPAGENTERYWKIDDEEFSTAQQPGEPEVVR